MWLITLAIFGGSQNTNTSLWGCVCGAMGRNSDYSTTDTNKHALSPEDVFDDDGDDVTTGGHNINTGYFDPDPESLAWLHAGYVSRL